LDYSKQRDSEILFWLNDQELEEIFSSRYWNDEAKEKEKDFYICEGDEQKLIKYLKEKTTYYAEYESIIKFLAKIGLRIKSRSVDVAAGVCWTSALLSKIESVERIYAVEISKHRVLKIAPRVFDLFNANTKKIKRVIGNFYNMKLGDASIDFCFMSQAFHHADNPDKLLYEVYRILRPSGFILIIGEKVVSQRDFLRRYIKNAVKIFTHFFIRYRNRPVYKLFPSFADLYPPNKESGDHYYRIKDYRNIFKSNGFLLYKNKQRDFTTFVAMKQ